MDFRYDIISSIEAKRWENDIWSCINNDLLWIFLK